MEFSYQMSLCQHDGAKCFNCEHHVNLSASLILLNVGFVVFLCLFKIISFKVFKADQPFSIHPLTFTGYLIQIRKFGLARQSGL